MGSSDWGHHGNRFGYGPDRKGKGKPGRAKKTNSEKVILYNPPPGVPLFLHTHSMPPLQEWVPYVIGCEPIYLAGYGNASLITLEDASQMVLGRGMTWIQKSIHRYYGTDEDEIRRKFQHYINMVQSVPFIVPPRQLVLFAVKTRIPQHHNDGATGYVANTAIETVEFLTYNQTRIHLSTGQDIDTLMSTDAVRMRRRTAELFAFLLHRDGIM